MSFLKKMKDKFEDLIDDKDKKKEEEKHEGKSSRLAVLSSSNNH